MKKVVICCLFALILLVFPVKLWAEDALLIQFIEDRLVDRGLDKSLAQNMTNNLKISLQPHIVIKNLFYSSPQGTENQPDIMQIDPQLIKGGIIFIEENKESLLTLEKRFGTSPQIITSILIVESKLGTYPMRYNVVNAYINLGLLLDSDYFSALQQEYGDKYPLLYDKATIKRAKSKAWWAFDELYHLVHLANELKIDPLSIMGSFAGAIGPAQFIPSTFRSYGIDGDEDGIINPLNMQDAEASIGHYLKSSGWSEEATLKVKRKAIWKYNHSEVYVNTIMLLYDELGKNKITDINSE